MIKKRKNEFKAEHQEPQLNLLLKRRKTLRCHNFPFSNYEWVVSLFLFFYFFFFSLRQCVHEDTESRAARGCFIIRKCLFLRLLTSAWKKKNNLAKLKKKKTQLTAEAQNSINSEVGSLALFYHHYKRHNKKDRVLNLTRVLWKVLLGRTNTSSLKTLHH